MAYTIEEIQQNITNKADPREIINQLADFLQANPPSSSPGGDSGYLVYTALLSQTGENGPTVVSAGSGANTPVENTIGDIVWTYGSEGSFIGTLAGAFPQTKTIPFISNNAGGNIQFSIAWDSVNTIVITSTDSGVGANDWLSRTPIEIRVYP